MAVHSAGILLYRNNRGRTQVLLVHPGGPYWVNKDAGAWSIPKGEYTDENPLQAAIREMKEETGYTPEGKFIPLDPVRLKSGKIIHAWALEGDMDVTKLKSNLFEMEWPPRSGKKNSFPEVDRAEWYDLTEAAGKINPGQKPLLSHLERILTAI